MTVDALAMSCISQRQEGEVKAISAGASSGSKHYFLVSKGLLTSINLTVNGQNTFHTSFMC